MADKTQTVDELSIRISANAEQAAKSLDVLTTSLGRLVATLTPATQLLKNVATVLNSTKGASAGLKTIMNQAGSGVSSLGTKADRTAKALDRLRAAQRRTSVATTQGFGQMTTTQLPSRAISTPTPKASTASSFTTIQTQAAKTAWSVRNVTSALGQMSSKGVKHTSLLRGSFIQLRSSIFFGLFALGAITTAFKNTVLVATDYVETLNLFNVAMRNNRAEADAFVASMQRAFGLDPERIMKYQATFFQVAESMGVTNKNAYTLSETLTRLTFDIASLRNMKLEEVFTKVQAVLTGQDKSIRSLGGSIQMTTLKEYALSLGIKEQVSTMTQAEKALLRLGVFYRQSSIAQGDMARTLMQPANMLRVLTDQVAITARAIGSLFIGALIQVVPYIIFFVRAVGQAASALASFFGVDISAMSGDIGDISDTLSSGMADSENSAQGAADAVKKMRDYTMGIDELNIIPQQAPTGGGGAGGAGSAGATGNALTKILDKIREEMAKLMDEPFADWMDDIGLSIQNALVPIKPFIDALGDLWETLKPFAVNVWQGFTDFFNNVLIPLGKWTMNTVGVAVVESLAKAFDFMNKTGISNLIGNLLAFAVAMKGLSLAAKGLWAVLKFVFGWSFIGKLAANMATFLGVIGGGSIKSAFGIFVAEIGAGKGALTALSTAMGVSRLAALGTVAAYAAITVGTVAAGVALGVLLDKILNTIPAWKKGTEAAGEWIVKVLGLGKPTVELSDKMKALGFTVDDMGYIVDKNGNYINNFKQAMKDAKTPAYDYKTALDEVRGKSDELTRALDGTKVAVDSLAGAQRTAKDAAIAYKEAKLDLKDAQRDYNDAVRKYGKDSDEAQKAQLRLEKAELRVKDAADDLKEAQDKVFSKQAAQNYLDNLERIRQKWKDIGVVMPEGVTPYPYVPHTNPSKIPRKAVGGVESVGSMFVAGEAGPELIGSYGSSKTTVMPLENSGFVQAMYNAVYAAVSSAQTSGNGDMNFIVELDGVKVGKGVNKAMGKRGLSGTTIVSVS